MEKIAVCISTYNNPKYLEKTLYGYCYQTRPADEIIIADDGSGEETYNLINSFKDRLPITHVWHEDNGFQKTIILNKAIMATDADYIIFTDQDCIPRKDLISAHISHAKRGYFLSSSYHKLPLELSNKVTDEDIISGRLFDLKWLRKNGHPLSSRCIELVCKNNKLMANVFNNVSKTGRRWSFIGCNASCWRDDLLRVNGFDNTVLYGGDDSELGVRLLNSGIKVKYIRCSAVVMHLDHERPYKSEETILKNRTYIFEIEKNGLKETPNGIKELDI